MERSPKNHEDSQLEPVSIEWLKSEMAKSKPIDPNLPILITHKYAPDSFRVMISRKAAGIAFTGTLLTALVVTVATPPPTKEYHPGSNNNHGPRITIYEPSLTPQPAPKPSS